MEVYVLGGDVDVEDDGDERVVFSPDGRGNFRKRVGTVDLGDARHEGLR